MNTSSITLAMLAICIALSSTEVEAGRLKRRVKPRTKPLDLAELRRQCIHHGWPRCSRIAHELYTVNSSANNEYTQCLEEAPKTIKLQVPIIENNATQITTTEDSTAKGNCTTKSRDDARHLYCDYFRNITKNAVNIVSENTIYKMRDLVPCVNWKESKEELTPKDIVNTIELWIRDVDLRHRDCCGGPLVPTRKSDDEENRTGEWTQVSCAPWFHITPTEWWDAKLASIAKLMKQVDRLEKTGRRKKCLRGCVTVAEVDCAAV